MSEELQDELVKNLQDGLSSSKDFLSEQVSPLVQEVIMWQRAYYTTWTILSSLIMLICVIVIWRTKKVQFITEKAGLHSEYTVPANLDELKKIVHLFVAYICFLIFSLVNIHHSNYAIKYWASPRLAVVDYVSDIVKNQNSSRR